MITTIWTGLALLAGNVPSPQDKPTDKASGLLFREGFDDDRLTERGWYDGTKFEIAREGAHAGSGCIAYHWKPGTTSPDNSSGIRRLFDPTDTVYLRCYIKLSKDWGWTGRAYHPHLMHFMTTENGRYHGPAASHLTVYIEPQEGKLRLAAQDIQNQDTPHGLTQGPLRGGYNGKFYDSKDGVFVDDQWHCVEALFKLNSLDLERDKPNADGIVRGWFDGKLVIDHTDVVLRSTDFPKMQFNQFLLLPYFGPGLLPHEQTLWIDELAVGTKRLEASSRERGGDARRLRGPEPHSLDPGGRLIATGSWGRDFEPQQFDARLRLSGINDLSMTRFWQSWAFCPRGFVEFDLACVLLDHSQVRTSHVGEVSRLHFAAFKCRQPSFQIGEFRLGLCVTAVRELRDHNLSSTTPLTC